MTSGDHPPPALTGRGRRRRTARATRARPLADEYDGVASRALLRAVGISRDDVRAEVSAGRWRLHSPEVVVLTPDPVTGRALWWAALWETGCAAVLDGATSLQASGLTGFDSDAVHVSVAGGFRPRRSPGVVTHTLRSVGPTVGGGIPRTRPRRAAPQRDRHRRDGRAAHSADRASTLAGPLPRSGRPSDSPRRGPSRCDPPRAARHPVTHREVARARRTGSPCDPPRAARHRVTYREMSRRPRCRS